MNRKEAIKILKDLEDVDNSTPVPNKLFYEAFDMAIEALSANYTTEKPNDIVEQENDVVVEPTDLISRADAIKAIESRQTEQWIDADVDYNNGLESAVAEIKALPSADRPSGEWVIRENGNKECSLCGHERQDGWDYFCGYCGARMKGGDDE